MLLSVVNNSLIIRVHNGRNLDACCSDNCGSKDTTFCMKTETNVQMFNKSYLWTGKKSYVIKISNALDEIKCMFPLLYYFVTLVGTVRDVRCIFHEAIRYDH